MLVGDELHVAADADRGDTVIPVGASRWTSIVIRKVSYLGDAQGHVSPAVVAMFINRHLASRRRWTGLRFVIRHNLERRDSVVPSAGHA